MNLPPITIEDRPHLHKRVLYTPDLLPFAISVASENAFSNLTTPSYSPYLLPSDDPNTLYVIIEYEPYRGRVKRGYLSRKHDKKYASEIQGSIAPRALIKKRNFIIVMVFPVLIKRQGLASWNINILCQNLSADCCVLSPFHPLLYLLKLFCVFFHPVTRITPCNIPYV